MQFIITRKSTVLSESLAPPGHGTEPKTSLAPPEHLTGLSSIHIYNTTVFIRVPPEMKMLTRLSWTNWVRPDTCYDRYSTFYYLSIEVVSVPPIQRSKNKCMQILLRTTEWRRAVRVTYNTLRERAPTTYYI